MNKNYKIPKALLLIIFIISCQSKPQGNNALQHNQPNLIERNKIWVKKDRQSIVGYVNRMGLTMRETPTGLWYHIKTKGNGAPVKTNKVVEINYQVYLLDGTLLYSSKANGPKTFLVGKGGVESGLEEGVLLLKTGDKARFLMPPHLAYGHTGDGKRIPPRAILDYHVEVLKVYDN